MLKEVKTTKIGKCSECHRELRVGWTVFFEDTTKATFCKPCGITLHNQGLPVAFGGANNSNEDDLSALVSELISEQRASRELLGAFDLNLSSLRGEIVALGELITKKLASAKPVTQAKK